jgi:demethylmenaquinone methyltransferase/2-methoxy-6-polyprenyl-1,4-benzoquinol methylase
MFDAIAPSYDRLNHLLSLSLDRWWRLTTVHLTLRALEDSRAGENPYKPMRILDVATGTGDLALAFARRLGDAACYVGVDFSHSMLRLARKKTLGKGREAQLAFVEADGQDLPFPAESFDAATIAFGLRNAEHPERLLGEMARVVRPGGVVAILEFYQPDDPVFRKIYLAYFQHVLPRIGGWISRSAAYGYLPASVLEFWDMKETRRRLARCRLRPVQSWRLSAGIVGLHIARRPSTSLIEEEC